MKYEITSKTNERETNFVRIVLDEPNNYGYYPMNIIVHYTRPGDRTRSCVINCCFPYKMLDEYIVDRPMDLQYELHEKHALPLVVYIANALAKKKLESPVLFKRIVDRVNKSIAWYNSTYLADVQYKLPEFKSSECKDMKDKSTYLFPMPCPDICLGM